MSTADARMTESYDVSGENSKLLLSEHAETEKSPVKTLKARVWPYLVLVSCFLSFSLASGFNFGIVGSLTEAQQADFNVTLGESSWSGSVHTATFRISGRYLEM